jgi:hypothetical protein
MFEAIVSWSECAAYIFKKQLTISLPSVTHFMPLVWQHSYSYVVRNPVVTWTASGGTKNHHCFQLQELSDILCHLWVNIFVTLGHQYD